MCPLPLESPSPRKGFEQRGTKLDLGGRKAPSVMEEIDWKLVGQGGVWWLAQAGEAWGGQDYGG